jgi:hypothetical protein
MKGRKLPRGIYRRGNGLWIRLKNATRGLSRESTEQGDVKVAEAILAKRRTCCRGFAISGSTTSGIPARRRS